MKTLSELRQLAKADRPERDPDVAALLVTWAQHDPAAAPWLQQWNMAADAWSQALHAQQAPDKEQDRAVLLAASQMAGSLPATALELLRALALYPKHPVYRALVSLGLPWDRWNETPHPPTASAALSGLLSVAVQLPATAAGWKRYGRDLTEEAKNGAFAGLLERPDETNRLVDVVLRRTKGNAVLTGPAGVGKTALVESLAVMALRAEHPLHGWRFVELSMGKVVAGTQYRGQFEERIESVLQAMTEMQPALLFIDELHLLVGSGRAEGAAMDGSNLLKPYLARGALRVIGATTTEEYHRYIARDKALARRFQEVVLLPPDPELARQMLVQQAEAIAAHHQLTIAPRTIDQVIALTEQHLPHRHQPDKSIDLLDTAAAAVRRQGRRQIEGDDLLETLSRLSGLPLGRLSTDARVYLSQVAQRIKQRLKGQDEAVDRVVATLLQRRLQIDERRRPLAVFLFTGDTGVGKTELGRLLASEFLGDAQQLVHLDMAEYCTPAAVHKLTGAAPGLVGSEDEGVLIQALQGSAQGVLLLDEFEKADPEVHRLLLALLDEGRIRSARGQMYDARGWIIVMTSNALKVDQIQRPAVGFGTASSTSDVRELLAEHFPRELLGRVDEVLVFRNLETDTLRQILQSQIQRVQDRLVSKGIRLQADPNALLNHLLGQMEAHTGARGVARAIERGLLQPLAKALLLSDPDQPLDVVLDERFYRDGQISTRPT